MIPDMAKAIVKQKAKSLKRYPCTTNRASSIGYFMKSLNGCLRRGVYERENWADKELPDGIVALIFEEGNHQERIVLENLAKAGFDIIEQQSPFQWKEHNITGHCDGKLAVDVGGKTEVVPIEIKSMSPNIYSQVNSFSDFMKYSWTRSYIAQITLYMLMQEIDKGIFILKNKSTGEVKQIVVELDMGLGEECIQTCDKINKHIDEKTLPDQIEDVDVCKKCPFKSICLPDMNFDQIKIADDPSLEKKIDEYVEHNPKIKEISKLYKEEISPKMKATAEGGELNVMLGKYHLTGKTGSNGTFRPKIKLI